MAAGTQIMQPDGKAGLGVNGKRLVYRADGTCPKCCGSDEPPEDPPNPPWDPSWSDCWCNQRRNYPVAMKASVRGLGGVVHAWDTAWCRKYGDPPPGCPSRGWYLMSHWENTVDLAQFNGDLWFSDCCWDSFGPILYSVEQSAITRIECSGGYDHYMADDAYLRFTCRSFVVLWDFLPDVTSEPRNTCGVHVFPEPCYVIQLWHNLTRYPFRTDCDDCQHYSGSGSYFPNPIDPPTGLVTLYYSTTPMMSLASYDGYNNDGCGFDWSSLPVQLPLQHVCYGVPCVASCYPSVYCANRYNTAETVYSPSFRVDTWGLDKTGPSPHCNAEHENYSNYVYGTGPVTSRFWEWLQPFVCPSYVELSFPSTVPQPVLAELTDPSGDCRISQAWSPA